MKNTYVWLSVLGICLLLAIWFLGFGVGGCTSSMNGITASTSTTSSSVTTISYPTFTHEYIYATTMLGVPGPGYAVTNTTSAYKLDPITGKLTSVEAFSDIAGATLICGDPTGKLLFTGGVIYMAGNYSNEIHSFSINSSTGILSGPSVKALPYPPNSAAIDPSVPLIYIGSQNNHIMIYGLDPNSGILTFNGTKEPLPVGGNLFVTVDPTGTFLYACDQYDNQGLQGRITAYKIANSQTGDLDFIETYNTGLLSGALTNPKRMVIDAKGKFAYVEEDMFTNILVYSIEATTGKLSPIQTEAVGSGIGDIAIDPLGRFLYATTGNKGVQSRFMNVYPIDQTSGTLSSPSNTAIPAGSQYIATDPSGQFICLAPDNLLEVYRVESGGVLTLVDSLETGVIQYRPMVVGIK